MRTSLTVSKNAGLRNLLLENSPTPSCPLLLLPHAHIVPLAARVRALRRRGTCNDDGVLRTRRDALDCLFLIDKVRHDGRAQPVAKVANAELAPVVEAHAKDFTVGCAG
jgi:hypothetical protein